MDRFSLVYLPINTTSSQNTCMTMASAMLKKSEREKDSRGKSTKPESVSLPVQFPLTTISHESFFERMSSPSTIHVTKNTVGQGSSRSTMATRTETCTSPQNQVNEETGNESVENRNSQNFDNLAKCLEMLTNTITAGFQGLKSDMAELVCEKSDNNYVDNNYESDEFYSDGEIYEKDSESNTMTVDDLLSKTKLSGSISGKPDSGKNENESGSQSRFMKVASEQVTLQDVTTEPIHKDLAKLVNDLMFKVKIDKKLAEQVKESAEKIKRPENCESLVCTKVDELIWNRLQVPTKSLDSRFQYGQLFLVKSVTVLVNILDKIVSNKDVEKEELVRELIKTVEMLSYSNYELNMRRRECLKSDIDSVNYLSLFSSGVPINQFLFGGELGKRLDEIEKTNKAVNRVMTSKNMRRGTFHGARGQRFQPYSRPSGSQGYFRSRNAPFLGQTSKRGNYNRKFTKGKKKQE